jgi:outer membrane receptor protein involved in Fe transport
VVVTETAALLETTQSQVTKTIDDRTILELPGRNALNGLALLNPGVLPNQNGRPGSGFSVNGNRTRSNNFTIDGANNNDESLSIPRQTLPPEAIGEFQLITNNFAAEFGRNAGSYVNVITRSGNNEFHGIAHYTWQGNGLDALSTGQQRTYTTQRGLGLADKPALRLARSVVVDNLYGGTLGGPIKKDHTFFFSSLDFNDVRQTVSSVQRDAITQAGIDALRAASSQFAPGALDFLLRTFPVANDPTNRGLPVPVVNPADGSTVANLQLQRFNRTLGGGIPYGTDFWRYLGKVDTKINSKDQLSFRYIIDEFNDPGSPASIPGTEIGQVSRNQSFTINDVYAITSNLINESRATYSRRNINFPENLPTTFTVRNLTAFNIGNGNFPQFRIDNAYELTDNISYIRGKHNWKFGVNALRYDLNSFFAPDLRGTVSYGTLSDFLFDQNARVSQFSGDGSVPARTYETGFFAQDDWRFNQDLTLNLGLRYEYTTTPFGFFSNAEPDVNNFAPAVGFAWNPKEFQNGRFVLRGGYRISYDQVFQNVLLNNSRNFPRAVQLVSTVTGTQPYNGLPTAPQPQEFINRGGNPNLLPLRLFSPNKRVKQPNSQQFTLGVQYQLANDYVLKIDYIGTKGSNLIREIESNLGFRAPIGNGLRLDPTKGSILIGDGIADSIYNAGQITIEKRFGDTPYGSLQFNVNYTYSSFLSESDDVLGGQTNRTLPADPRNPGLDRARSGFDQPHRFVASYTYGIPKFQAGSGLLKSFVDRAVNGWELAGVTTIADGTPYSVLSPLNALGILEGQISTVELSQRVTLFQNGDFSQSSLFNANGQLINPNAAFIAFPANSGVLGTLGANTQRTGGFNNTNLALIKNIKTISESQSFQFRWEVTNVFNRRNFTVIPANTAGANLFLDLGQTNVGGRSMIFTGRYIF